ncbi:Nif3-like dinuclear metal center hexameric protein [Pseudohongiella nitratireducens]|uniref:Nif3-like dinuclear metal center hexameric protein n=1 Tax=Pseudohongiella nitratireducens TaxID=1768907 RepID=UPI0030ED7C35
MTVLRDDLVKQLNRMLRVDQFNDYCPNGLQVEGAGTVRRIISGVTASQALIEAAIERQADTVLVHHGYFWKGEPAAVAGMKKQRLKLLLEHDINLLAYHLPLDAHAEFGNNVQLARVLDLPISGELMKQNNQVMGLFADLDEAISGEQLASRLHEKLGRQALHIASSANKTIKRIAWCTGGAQSYIHRAVDIGADAYISGEVSEPTFHTARELGIHYYAAGHHATERYGAKALGEWLAAEYDLVHEFVDIDNPV